MCVMYLVEHFTIVFLVSRRRPSSAPDWKKDFGRETRTRRIAVLVCETSGTRLHFLKVYVWYRYARDPE